ncbi:protein anon-37Cs-like [Cydia pomonella]|uniref:protein anon-37Cs-like n=1 Tax=Cydia pomonella TaxID=82600 RepID=UPI002ADD5407|nr:protein anon-37Cs-like [Cydia pomonella]
MKILSKNVIPHAKCWLKITKRCIGGSEDPPVTAPCAPDMVERGICASEPCEPGTCYPEPRVVIIGAGMAGLSAAVRLTQRGINNYVILEAYERPGGRIRSVFLSDVVAELGAGYDFSHCPSHPIYKMAAQENPPRPGVPATAHPRGLFHKVAAGKMDCRPVITAYYKFRQIEQEAASIFCLGGSKQHGSLVNFMSLRIQQELHEFPEDQQHDAARIMFGLSHMLTARCGYDSAMLCFDHIGCYMSMPGGAVRVPLGTLGALAPLLRIIPEGRIRYCKPVSCVYWGTAQKQGHRAIVCTPDGEEFHCDYVISTVSIGVLLAHSSRLFCPQLPLPKMCAMNYIGNGLFDNIYFAYYRPFWFWHNADIDFKCCHSQLGGGNDWTRGITTIQKVPSSNNVLCIRVVGEEARMMETLSDQDLAESITSLLRCHTGNNCIPYPMTIVRSNWASDPFFMGSYSYEKSDSCGQAQRTLGCPVPGPGESCPPIILIAGEATTPYHFGTIAGARLSGIREAERIVQLTLQFEGPPLRDLRREDMNAEAKKCEAKN